MESFLLEVSQFYTQISQTFDYVIKNISNVCNVLGTTFNSVFSLFDFPIEISYFLGLITFFLVFDFVRGR